MTTTKKQRQRRRHHLSACARAEAAIAGLRRSQATEATELADALDAQVQALGSLGYEGFLAVRRRQGAVRRVDTTAADLFASCSAVRRAVASRYRGASHTEVRRAFGQGHIAGATKPTLALDLARQILAAAQERPGQLQAAGVGLRSIARIERLLLALEASASARQTQTAARSLTRIEGAAALSRLDALCAQAEDYLASLIVVRTRQSVGDRLW